MQLCFRELSLRANEWYFFAFTYSISTCKSGQIGKPSGAGLVLCLYVVHHREEARQGK